METGNPPRSCLAFVGLSWTLNVFLIKRLSVSKPPRGVYSLPIKWERGISLPPALPENVPGGSKGTESSSVGNSALPQTSAWNYLSKSPLPIKERTSWQYPLFPLHSLPPDIWSSEKFQVFPVRKGTVQRSREARLQSLFNFSPSPIYRYSFI